MIILALAETSIQLVPDGTLLFHIALVLVMVAVLNKTLFQPINKILDDRESRGAGASAEAAELRIAAGQHLATYETALRSARTEGYRRTELERSEEMKAREAELNSVKAEITSLIQSEKEIIKSRADEAGRELRAEAQVVAAEISERILRR